MNRIRPIAITCALTFMFGNAFFSLISLVPTDWLDIKDARVWTVLIARFIVGIGTGTTRYKRVAFVNFSISILFQR
jgi:hypothetical protein